MNSISNISFGRVKYTTAGKEFAARQSEKSQQILKNAEKQMKKYKHTNLVVNNNGYAIQHYGESGLHSYKISCILFSCNKNVNYCLENKKSLVFSLSKKKAKACAICAADDASENNSFLTSTIKLTTLLEKQGRGLKKSKNNFLSKMTSVINKSLAAIFV